MTRTTHRATPRSTAAAGARPTFRELDRETCERILARNSVGRLGFTVRGHVDIEPISYIYDAGWLYGRTSPGSKLTALAHSHWVAFEVDEVEGHFDWRSVVVHGSFLTLDPDVPGAEGDAWARGASLLSEVVPDFGTPDDPAGFRTVLFRIHLDEVTGREATTSPA